MTAAAPPPPRGGHATTSWQLAEGDVIVPGRRALRLLGGGRRHEAYLTWDEHLHALVVAKLLRPHQVREAAARQAAAAVPRLVVADRGDQLGRDTEAVARDRVDARHPWRRLLSGQGAGRSRRCGEQREGRQQRADA